MVWLLIVVIVLLIVDIFMHLITIVGIGCVKAKVDALEEFCVSIKNWIYRNRCKGNLDVNELSKIMNENESEECDGTEGTAGTECVGNIDGQAGTNGLQGRDGVYQEKGGAPLV